MSQALADSSWESWVETHRNELTNQGLWGVPSFRLGGFSTWGQDRFWRLREHLNSLVEIP